MIFSFFFRHDTFLEKEKRGSSHVWTFFDSTNITLTPPCILGSQSVSNTTIGNCTKCDYLVFKRLRESKSLDEVILWRPNQCIFRPVTVSFKFFPPMLKKSRSKCFWKTNLHCPSTSNACFLQISSKVKTIQFCLLLVSQDFQYVSFQGRPSFFTIILCSKFCG